MVQCCEERNKQQIQFQLILTFILLITPPFSPLMDNLTLILSPWSLVIVTESVRFHFISNKLFILTVLTAESFRRKKFGNFTKTSERAA